MRLTPLWSLTVFACAQKGSDPKPRWAALRKKWWHHMRTTGGVTTGLHAKWMIGTALLVRISIQPNLMPCASPTSLSPLNHRPNGPLTQISVPGRCRLDDLPKPVLHLRAPEHKGFAGCLHIALRKVSWNEGLSLLGYAGISGVNIGWMSTPCSWNKGVVHKKSDVNCQPNRGVYDLIDSKLNGYKQAFWFFASFWNCTNLSPPLFCCMYL